jgi:RNA polymerase sigma-70 factor (ECF subfamily)
MDEPLSTTIQKATRGDAVALDALLERYLPQLRAFVRLRLGAGLRAKESSDDIVQSVCRQVLQDVDVFEFRGEVRFKHWLYSAALRKIRDRYRFYHREKRSVDRERPIDAALLREYVSFSTPSQAAMQKEELAAFEEVFDTLPEDYKEVITLSRLIGLDHAEIAAQMGRSEQSVRMLLFRALAKLGVALERSRRQRGLIDETG